MKIQFQLTAILFCFFLVFSSFTHPIKLTSSMIRYDVNTSNIWLECKVFIDDFAPAIAPDLEKKINDLNLSPSDKKLIQDYFVNNFRIFINENKVPLKFEKYTVKENVMTISFSKCPVQIKKGNQLKIENELLFEKFPDIQSNWMTIKIPPYLKNYNFESKFENFSYTHTF